MTGSDRSVERASGMFLVHSTMARSLIQVTVDGRV
jgi:hypothetical protein